MSDPTMVLLADLRLDGGTQPRAAIDETVVREYAEAMQEGAAFPPVVVFHDGVDFWLADGFHRVHAARSLVLLDIEADVRTGTRREAVLWAMGANAAHGMRRTNADKRRAVLTLLEDEEWSKWGDREIGRRCAVDRGVVERLRADLPSAKRQVVHVRDSRGREYEMDTSGLRTKREKEGGDVTEDSEKEPAPAGIRRLPKQDDVEMFRGGVQSLTGLCLGLKKVTTDEVRSAPDVLELRGSIREAVSILRWVYKTIGGNGESEG